MRSAISLLLLLPLFMSVDCNAQGNVVDLDLSSILGCEIPDGTPLEIEDEICNNLLDAIVQDLLQAEAVLDAIFVGYDKAVPISFVEKLGVTTIKIRFSEIDNMGGAEWESQPVSIAEFPANDPKWFFAASGDVELDVSDVISMVNEDRLVDAVVQASLRTMGLPQVFNSAGFLVATTLFETVEFVGPINSLAIREFRMESSNPLAQFVPLDDATGGEFLTSFEPTFFGIDPVRRDILTAPLATSKIRTFMTRTSRGMYADLGYSIPGINADGIIDLNGDGKDDKPLYIRPLASDCLMGDVNQDGVVTLLDVAPFVELILNSTFQCEGDFNQDGLVSLLDVGPFVELLSG